MLRSKLFYTSLMANFLVLLWSEVSPVGATVIFDDGELLLTPFTNETLPPTPTTCQLAEA